MSRIFVEMTEEEYQEYCELKQENESSNQPKEEHDSTRDCVEKLINKLIQTSEETYFDPTIDRFIRLTRYRTALNDMDVELVTKEYNTKGIRLKNVSYKLNRGKRNDV